MGNASTFAFLFLGNFPRIFDFLDPKADAVQFFFRFPRQILSWADKSIFQLILDELRINVLPST